MSFYWNLFRRIAILSTNSMLVYRGNLAFFFVFETLFLAANFIGLSMGVEASGGILSGYSKNQVLFIAMLFQVGHQFFSVFSISAIFHVGWFIWNGRMDYVLLKPLPPFIGIHAATEFIISNIPNLILNMILFGYSFYQVIDDGYTPSVLQICLLFVFFTISILIRYGLALLVVTPTFFTEKASDGEDSYWSLQSLAKYPNGVFPRLIQNTFSFVLPIVTIAAIPGDVFFGRSSITDTWPYFAYACLFFFGCYRFFVFGVSRYQSVNTGV